MYVWTRPKSSQYKACVPPLAMSDSSLSAHTHDADVVLSFFSADMTQLEKRRMTPLAELQQQNLV